MTGLVQLDGTILHPRLGGVQEHPKITVLNSGQYVVVWDDAGHGVYAELFEQNGTSANGPVRVDDDASYFHQGFQYYKLGGASDAKPQVTSLSDGGYVVVWTPTDEYVLNNWALYAQRFSSSGAPVGSRIVVNDTTDTSSDPGGNNDVINSGATAVALPGGAFDVNWYSKTGGFVTQRYDNQNNPVGGVQSAPPPSPWVQASSADGSHVEVREAVVHTDFFTSETNVTAQFYDKSGAPLGKAIQVNTTQGWDGDAPSVAALSDGTYMVAWTAFDHALEPKTNPDGSVVYGADGYPVLLDRTSKLFTQRYSADGAAIGSETQVPAFYSQNNQYRQTIAAAANAGYVLAWSEQGPINVDAIQYYNLQGSPIGPDIVTPIPDPSAKLQANLGSEGAYTWYFEHIHQEQFLPDIQLVPLNNGSYTLTYSSWLADGYFQYADGKTQNIFVDRFALGGTSRDTLFGDEGNNLLIGTPGNDVVIGLAGADRIVGNGGIDTADYTGSSVGVNLNLAFGQSLADRAGVVFVGGERVVNQITSGDQYGDGVAVLANGNAVAVWEDLATGLIDFRIMSAAGPVGDQHAVGTGYLGSVTGLASGKFLVAWSDATLSTNFVEVFAADGTVMRAPFAVGTHSTYLSYSYPSIAAESPNSLNDQFVITQAYTIAAGGAQPASSYVRLELWDPSANIQSNDIAFKVADTSAFHSHSQVVGLGIGGANSDEHYAAVVFDDAQGEIKLWAGSLEGFYSRNETTTATLSIAGHTSAFPSIANMNGTLVVAWADQTLGQVLYSVGDEFGPFSAPLPVTAFAGLGRLEAKVAALGNGFVIMWEDSAGFLPDGSPQTADFGGSIHARLFHGNGTPAGDEFVVNTTTDGSQVLPQIASGLNNEIIALWSDPSGQAQAGEIPDTSSTGVKAQWLDFTPHQTVHLGRGLGGDAQGDRLVDVQNLIGSANDDHLTGDDQANVLTGGGGNDYIDGGAGLDVAVFSGAASDYAFGRAGLGAVHVRDMRAGSPDGTDTVTNVEAFRFAGSGTDLSLAQVNALANTPPPTTFALSEFGTNAGGWTSNDQFPRELADVNGDGMADIVGFGTSGVYVALATGGGNFGPSNFKLAAFGPAAGGWSSADQFPRRLADVNGDGIADIVGFGNAGVTVALATGGGNFGTPTLKLTAFGAQAGGWDTNDHFPRELADVNGDGMADIVGFGTNGVYVALATGGGNFGTSTLKLAAFGPAAGGWDTNDHFPRELADVNGDGMADIVGFGNNGVYVALATGGGNFGPSHLVLSAFGPAAGGWDSQSHYPRELADINGDHKVDIVGFGETGLYVAYGNGDGTFQAPVASLQAFTPSAGGWNSDSTTPRELADINGNGSADIVGFGPAGVTVALSTGGGLFGTPTFALSGFGPTAGGWDTNDHFPRELADVNGDGMADIIGFGNGGVTVALATGGGNFGPSTSALAAFGAAAGGWDTNDHFPRHLADVNGDGRADIVGFGNAGVTVALATGGGNFATPNLTLAAFGPAAGGWDTNDHFPRELADVNGDGMADIVGFGNAGVTVALATGGGNFATPNLTLAAFGPAAGGWTSNDQFPRELADLNGDGMADIVGFGNNGVYVALATGGGNFGPSHLVLNAFGPAAGGWDSQSHYPRELADINNDGKIDIVGFGENAVYAALGNGDGSFQAPTAALQAFSHASGWSNDNAYPRHLADINGDGAADIVGFGANGVYEALSNGFHLV